MASGIRAGTALLVALSACGGGAQRPGDGGRPDSGLPSADGLELCSNIPIGSITRGSTFEVVLDRSAGMGVTLPGSDRTVWERTRDALLPFAVSSPMGLTLFPDDGDCARGPVAVPASTRQSATALAMETALTAATPGGRRPTADAVALAIADGAALAPLLGRPTVLLLTNGAPEAPSACGGGDGLAALRALFQGAYDAGIYACIAALPGTGAAAGGLREVALAGAGGDPTRSCYVDYDSADGAERLGADLCAGGCAVPRRFCRLPVSIDETMPLVDARLLVTLDGAPTVSLARTPGCEETSPGSGWDVVDGQWIQLCGSLCAEVNDAWTGTLTLTTPCYVP